MADPSKSELLELARQAVSAEDYIRADEYYSQAIRFMPSSDPDYAECLECLVSLKQARGDFPAALEYSLRLIKLGEDMLGPDHALVGAWKKQVAHINAQLGRLSEGSGFPKPPPEPEIVLVPNPAPLPRPFQTPPGTSQNSTIKSQKSSGSFVESVDSDAPDKTLSMRRSTEVKKPARPSARSQQNLGALDNEIDAGAIAKQTGKGKKGVTDAQVYVSVDNDNDDSDFREQQSAAGLSASAARKIQFSDQDMLEREQMYASEVRERNDNILRMVLVGLTTGILVASIYYCWSLYGISEQPANFTKSNPAADNVRYLRYLSNKTIQFGLGERSEKYQFTTFSISLEDFFRSLASAVLSKEYFLQDHGDYITDEDGTSYFKGDCAQQLTVHNMHKVSENCRIYYHRKSAYPRRIVDPDAGSAGAGAENSKGEKSDSETASAEATGLHSSASEASTPEASTSKASTSEDSSSESSASEKSASETSTSETPASDTPASETSTSDTSASGASTSNDSSQDGKASTEQPGEGEQSVGNSTKLAGQADLLTLENPYTKERERPLYLHALIEAPAKVDSETAIKQVLDGLRAGGMFPEEPVLKPGVVVVCHYLISGNGHQDSLLVVHGADENGKLIAASGVKKTFLYVQKNGTAVDNSDKTSPFGRSFLGMGPRIELRPNFLCVIECRPEFPIPLWVLRFRFILPALIASVIFFVMGKVTHDNINRMLAYGMAALSLVAAIVSIINAVSP
ncbi:MAG: hypothetical protein KA392_19530 [Candidatus Obscuribacter sp.]|nr:hypothetical protein [Candidatus Obscuribacter sp.]MBP6594985.1 hypothetical protein [Candidatus Obscuribacter sp.]